MKMHQIFDHKKAFVAYLTAGHRGLEYTEKAAIALVKGGVDILEVGVPFSDPVADGPTIQVAMTEALTHKITLTAIFKSIANIKRQVDAPIVLFTYYNPLYCYGVDKALEMASQAGVEGVLVVDLPLEESKDFFAACQKYAIQPICLLAPSTTPDRAKQIVQVDNQGFLYYVCHNGTTGVRGELPLEYAQHIQSLKAATHQPVVAGFGIGDREMARKVLQHSDGFVVGSAFVRAMIEGATPEALTEMAKAIDPR